MGLDNGIHLRRIGNKLDIDSLPDYLNISEVSRSEKEDNSVIYDICYWRKCWNIRSMIFGFIPKLLQEDNDGYYELNIQQLIGIRNGIYDFLKNPECWDNTIWELSEMILHLGQDIINISWLINHLKDNPKDYAYFYDSY